MALFYSRYDVDFSNVVEEPSLGLERMFEAPWTLTRPTIRTTYEGIKKI